jgi:hypothetical protein
MICGKHLEVVDVIESEKPDLFNAIGYWVRLPNKSFSQEKDLRKREKIPQFIQGFVNDLNEKSGVLKVIFEHDQDMNEQEVPFNSMDMTWYDLFIYVYIYIIITYSDELFNKRINLINLGSVRLVQI